MAKQDEIARMVVALEGKVSDFQKKMDQAERRGAKTYQGLQRNSRRATDQMARDLNRTAGSVNQSLGTISSKIGKFGAAFAGGLVAGAGMEALRSLVTTTREAAKEVAEIGNQARRAGVSAKEFQEWAWVAKQNRIEIDAFTDGLKEMQLRADEFAVTGKGSAAEAFQRLGYGADEVAKKMKNPSALLQEIFERLQKVDKASQIRIADELFGGTAGERFVELLDQGAEKIAATKKQAQDLGLVMSDELIAKAEMLNQQFNTIANTVGVALKSAIISAAASLSDFLDGFREFQNQRTTTLEGRQSDIMRERVELNEKRKKVVLPRDQQKIQQRIDELNKEEDSIIAELSKRNGPSTWKPKTDTWTPPAPTSPTGGTKGSKGSKGHAADVEKVADAYGKVKDAADLAREAEKKAQDQAQAGANAMSNVLLSLTDGMDGLKDAVANLLMQIAQAQMNKAFAGLAAGSGGGFFQALGSWMGFDQGGYTGDGGRLQPAGVVHKGEYVFSKAATSRIGAGNLESMHQRALRGYASGGYVGGSAGSASALDVKVTCAFDESGNLYVKNVAQQAADQAQSRAVQASYGMVNQSARAQQRSLDTQIQSYNMRGTTR